MREVMKYYKSRRVELGVRLQSNDWRCFKPSNIYKPVFKKSTPRSGRISLNCKCSIFLHSETIKLQNCL